MRSGVRAIVSILLMAIMTVTAFAVLTAVPVAAGGATSADKQTSLVDLSGSPVVKSSSPTLSASGMKLDPVLAKKITQSHGPYEVYVFVKDRQSVNEYLAANGLPTIRGKEFPGMPTVRLMELDAKQIYTLSQDPNVLKIMTYETPVTDPVPVDPALEGASVDVAPANVEDFGVVSAHGATDAWANGWSGTGVKIAVIDDGFDMAHPDLQGQQARYEDPTSPYYGWPIVYDDVGAMFWATNQTGGWVADTSTFVPAYGDYVYFDGMRYKVNGLKDVMGNPVTSASGEYHIGYHPDQNLADLWGYQVAVLVVDSTTPYVYDTVYVDVLGDYDFTNDKACTKGDEISYFDCFNATSRVTDTTNWNVGDGFADFSGGMVYWISDGSNNLPGANWTYGADFTPLSGNAVAFVGAFVGGASHGTMTSSAALATNKSWGGNLVGMAPGAKLIAIPFYGSSINDWEFAEFGADGLPNTGDEANIVSNSYGWSDTAVDAGYEAMDQFLTNLSLYGDQTLWCWSTGNGGPGYGTSTSPVDYTSVHVGAGTTYMYRYWTGAEPVKGYQTWGDVAPFSNSGPSRTGKLGAEIIASGMYSLNAMPLNMPDNTYSIGNGAKHYQIGSGTSHASPTVAGGAAIGFQAFMDNFGALPSIDYTKAILLGSSDDMHYDPLKQGAGWLNASRYAHLMAGDNEVLSLMYPGAGPPVFASAVMYPGNVYGTSYETFPNFLRPGEYTDAYSVETWNLDPVNDRDINVTSKILLRNGTDSMTYTTTNALSVYLDITSMVPANTDLLKATMWMSFSTFDPDQNYVSDVEYYLFLYDWVDLNHDGIMQTNELFRLNQDYKDCNYQQIMIKDPMKRVHDGLFAQFRPVLGMAGIDINLQLDYYELKTFPWVKVRMAGDVNWVDSLDFTLPAGYTNAAWEVNVSVPIDAPVGTYAAALYVADPMRVQCIPIVINVPASDYEFAFGGPSYFDTTYNNNMTGLADKGWRFETGDWRIYWCLPMSLPSAWEETMIVTVNWTELPTDVNVHVLAPFPADLLTPYGVFDPPLGPSYQEVPIASSDEKYMGAGVFGVYTSTSGPSEVIAAMDSAYNPVATYEIFTEMWTGSLSPFAILLRCPVMAGNTSSDMVSGFTSLVTMNGFSPSSISFEANEPGNVPLADVIPAWYDITTGSDVTVKGGGIEIMQGQKWPMEPIYQDSLAGSFEQALANAHYTRAVEVSATDVLYVGIQEVANAPDCDLGVWYDANLDGIADLSEPYWYVGISGSTESLTLSNPVPGQYLVKVLGYSVSGNPGYFSLTVATGVPDASITATDLEPLAGTGVHDFYVSYDLPARGGVYVGAATFGFMGSADMFKIPVEIDLTDVGAPFIENLMPADSSAINTATPLISFDLTDSVFYSGLDPTSVSVMIDGQEMGALAEVAVDHVTVQVPFALGQGNHTVTVSASDKAGNGAPPVTSIFEVNSVIEMFAAEFWDPGTGAFIPDGSIVNLASVDMQGWADPFADVTITAPSGVQASTADASGFWVLPALDLVEGANVVTIETTNDAMVYASMTKQIVSDTTCLLFIDPPESPTAMTSVDLSGWTDPDASVDAGGVSATVDLNGKWTATVTLAVEGLNNIIVTAVDSLGNMANGAVDIVLDTIPPTITLDGPDVYYTVNEPSAIVWGSTDVDATVYVNGVLAAISGTSWSATIVLSEGNNTVTITATDSLGNMVAMTIWVVYEPPVYVTPDELAAVQALLQDQLDSLTAALAENVSALQGQIDEQAAALAENVTQLQGQIDALTDSLGSDVAQLQALIDGLEDALAENRSALDALSITLQNDLSDLQDQLNRLNQTTQDDISTIDEKASDTDAFTSMLMYLTLILFAIAVILVGIVWYVMNGRISGRSGGSAPAMEEVDTGHPSEVEKEFEALEREIKKDEL